MRQNSGVLRQKQTVITSFNLMCYHVETCQGQEVYTIVLHGILKHQNLTLKPPHAYHITSTQAGVIGHFYFLNIHTFSTQMILRVKAFSSDVTSDPEVAVIEAVTFRALISNNNLENMNTKILCIVLQGNERKYLLITFSIVTYSLQ